MCRTIIGNIHLIAHAIQSLSTRSLHLFVLLFFHQSTLCLLLCDTQHSTMEGPVSPRRGGSELAVNSTMKKEKSKKKMKNTIKVMFKTEKKKKDKSKQNATKNAKLLIDFIEKNCMLLLLLISFMEYY